jgi:DNA replication protein DnaC
VHNALLLARIKRHGRGLREDLQDVICDPARGLDKSTLRQLATCQWVKAKQNVIAVGLTGIGKELSRRRPRRSCLPPGLPRALRPGSRLLEDLSVARASGAYGSTLASFAKLDVLVLDDFLLAPMSDRAPSPARAPRGPLRQILDRHHLPGSNQNWHDAINDPTTGDAICDRIVHNVEALRCLRMGSATQSSAGRAICRLERKSVIRVLGTKNRSPVLFWKTGLLGGR